MNKGSQGLTYITVRLRPSSYGHKQTGENGNTRGLNGQATGYGVRRVIASRRGSYGAAVTLSKTPVQSVPSARLLTPMPTVAPVAMVMLLPLLICVQVVPLLE